MFVYDEDTQDNTRFVTSILAEDLTDEHTIEIGDYAFFGYSKLVSVELAGNVTKVGASAFSGCVALESFVFEDGAPSLLTTIGEYAFYECESLERVALGQNLSRIGSGAFGGCRSLERVNFAGTVKQWSQIVFERYNNQIIETSNPLYYAHRLFVCGEELIEIEAEDLAGITSICEIAFINCASLESVKIPASVTTIGACVFKGCTNMRELVIEKNVEEVGNSAFDNCTSLEHILILCQDVSFVNAFDDCNAVEKVFYIGTAQEWINKNGNLFNSAVMCYYRETSEGLTPEYNGRYWHFDGNGNPVVWIV